MIYQIHEQMHFSLKCVFMVAVKFIAQGRQCHTLLTRGGRESNQPQQAAPPPTSSSGSMSGVAGNNAIIIVTGGVRRMMSTQTCIFLWKLSF